MNSIDERVITLLSNLTDICRDGQKWFETAAEYAESEGEREALRSYAEERREFVRELQAQIFALGGEGDKSRGVAGSLHRGWMNLRSAMTAKEAAALLGECERSEARALKTYRDALTAELDPETRALLNRQARSVEMGLNRLKHQQPVTASA